MKNTIKKIKASLIHLAISSIIVLIFTYVILYIWYPEPFYSISNIDNIILILISVDLILGPVLTFIVFQPQKSTLKVDLFIISIIQVLALSYGIHTIYQGRPIYVAYAVDRFTTIKATDIDKNNPKKNILQVSVWEKPPLVYVKKPENPEENSKLILEVMAGKADIDARPEYYEKITPYIPKILKNGIKKNRLLTDENNKKIIGKFIKKYGGNIDDYAFLALSGEKNDMVWAWRYSDKKPIAALAINPWNL